MKITTAHVQYYLLKKTPLPKFATQTKHSILSPSIHALINAAAGISHDCNTHNTLQMLRLARSNGILQKRLMELGGTGLVYRSEKRKANCRKWAKKIAASKSTNPNLY